jgi:hypothetical protein
MARPPVCQERLAVTESGQVVVRFKNAWRNGAHAVVLDPLDFIARLVALIPPPHFNMVRYHGVLAARAAVRSEVVPGAAPEQPEPIQLRLAYDGEATPVELEFKPASRHPWPLAARDAGIFGHSPNSWRVVVTAEGREAAAAEAMLLELRSLIDDPVEHVAVNTAQRSEFAQEWRTIDLRRSRLMRTGPTLLVVTASDLSVMVSSAPNLWSWIGGELWDLQFEAEQIDE